MSELERPIGNSAFLGETGRSASLASAAFALIAGAVAGSLLSNLIPGLIGYVRRQTGDTYWTPQSALQDLAATVQNAMPPADAPLFWLGALVALGGPAWLVLHGLGLRGWASATASAAVLAIVIAAVPEESSPLNVLVCAFVGWLIWKIAYRPERPNAR